ncbi:MAG TPA: outer membrane beta-barrel protein [Rhodopila sp.]|nr:outer membrane beta-barrel protein [Rhodopila sp.]
MRHFSKPGPVLLITAISAVAGALPAAAQTTPAAPAATSDATTEAPKPAAPEPPPPGLWIDGIHLSAQLDAGFTLNPMRPGNGLNYGQLFTDHANQAQLNQILLTANKPLDPKNSDFQWGFKLQGLYGSDARYTQFLGELNRISPGNNYGTPFVTEGDRYQFDIVEANALFHLPILTSGGMDVKAGQYPTPLGLETIDPSTNPFYSHSYIFQFGLPFKHTGVLTTTHVSDVLDVYAGVDSGTNTTFGPLGDNNGAVGAIGGVNLTLQGGKLTILALTHVGPEQATRVLAPVGFNANGEWRSYNDIVMTYKASDALTLTTELNWVRDAYGTVNKPVNAFGAAQYASYTLTDTVTLNARVELFRDDNNYFVSSFSGNNDPIRVQQGLPLGSLVYTGVNPATGSTGGSTYGELTLGVTYKPTLPAPVTGLLIRPEVRWDHAFTDNNPYNQNIASPTKSTANNFTVAADAVLTF